VNPRDIILLGFVAIMAASPMLFAGALRFGLI
jgi:hypothetical protein